MSERNTTVIIVYTLEYGIEPDTFSDEDKARAYADELAKRAAYRDLNILCARTHFILSGLSPFHNTKEGH